MKQQERLAWRNVSVPQAVRVSPITAASTARTNDSEFPERAPVSEGGMFRWVNTPWHATRRVLLTRQSDRRFPVHRQTPEA